MKTRSGRLTQDSSGLWHYTTFVAGISVSMAAQDAIEYRVGAAWFWFNYVPAPIYLSDNVETLVERWRKWRVDYQNDKLLYLLLSLT